MGFALGIVMFAVVLGWLDRKLPWPEPGRGRGRR
jgi:hypothetical protein